MKIAVEGCAHGDLENIYKSIALLERNGKFKVDLLLCCGDFQATRNCHDLQCMAVPQKYQHMCSFYKYYKGEKKAPILTIFIGGNHEASNHLQELPYGGWVAPNIYYLGYAGIVTVGGIRIGGISGIYKGQDYMMGHYERPPYSEGSKRSVYHVRNVEVFRFKQIKTPIDIIMSHDWPRGISKFGNSKRLLSAKPFFREDIENNKLGSPPCEELLLALKPKYWFSAHLHCKFSAIVPHENNTQTKFLALDKCLPRRKFLQILDLEHDTEKSLELEYDLEWLSVLHFTNHLTSIKKEMVLLPNSDFIDVRWDFTPTEVEKEFIMKKISSCLTVPSNFVQTAPPHNPEQGTPPRIKMVPNPQTQAFCQRLGIGDIFAEILLADPPKTPNMTSWTPQELSSFIESEDANDSDSSLTSTPNSGKTKNSDEEPLTPSPRQRLALPPPKSGDSGDIEIISIVPLDCTPSKDPTSPESEVFFMDTGPSTPVGPKKFKRRNQELYNDDDS